MRVYDPLMKYLDECGLQTVTLTYMYSFNAPPSLIMSYFISLVL